MKNIAWCLLLLCCQCALGQTTDLIKTDDLTNVTGNPYLFKDWCNGIVRFSGGRTMNQFKLKFDCLKNILLMQFDGNVFAADSKVQEFVLYPKNNKNKDSVLFRKGYPAVDRFTDATYYQVLFQDKITLLRLPLRNVIEEKQVVTVNGSLSRRIEEAEQYYLFQNGALVLLPDNRNELPDKFGNKKDAIAAFIAAQQLKMRSADDFVLVVKKYSELVP
jgi:hypothetical protein